MSQSTAPSTGSSAATGESLESSNSPPGPDLEFETFEEGYVRFEGFEGGQSLFSSYDATLEKLDTYDCNVVASPSQSAEVLEHYLGQHSNEVVLEDRLEDVDETILEKDDVEELDSSIVLQLETTAYDEGQHVYRHEGKIVPEVADYLANESCWSEHVHYVEEGEILFIRSNQ